MINETKKYRKAENFAFLYHLVSVAYRVISAFFSKNALGCVSLRKFLSFSVSAYYHFGTASFQNWLDFLAYGNKFFRVPPVKAK